VIFRKVWKELAGEGVSVSGSVFLCLYPLADG